MRKFLQILIVVNVHNHNDTVPSKKEKQKKKKSRGNGGLLTFIIKAVHTQRHVRQLIHLAAG